MKRLLLLTALLPFVGFAQPINTLNNPNQPGYQIPQPAADANSNADAANPAKRDAEPATENANAAATTAFRKPDKQ